MVRSHGRANRVIKIVGMAYIDFPIKRWKAGVLTKAARCKRRALYRRVRQVLWRGARIREKQKDEVESPSSSSTLSSRTKEDLWLSCQGRDGIEDCFATPTSWKHEFDWDYGEQEGGEEESPEVDSVLSYVSDTPNMQLTLVDGYELQEEPQ
jgi:hypothetical protein